MTSKLTTIEDIKKRLTKLEEEVKQLKGGKVEPKPVRKKATTKKVF